MQKLTRHSNRHLQSAAELCSPDHGHSEGDVKRVAKEPSRRIVRSSHRSARKRLTGAQIWLGAQTIQWRTARVRVTCAVDICSQARKELEKSAGLKDHTNCQPILRLLEAHVPNGQRSPNALLNGFIWFPGHPWGPATQISRRLPLKEKVLTEQYRQWGNLGAGQSATERPRVDQ